MLLMLLARVGDTNAQGLQIYLIGIESAGFLTHGVLSLSPPEATTPVRLHQDYDRLFLTIQVVKRAFDSSASFFSLMAGDNPKFSDSAQAIFKKLKAGERYVVTHISTCSLDHVSFQ